MATPANPDTITKEGATIEEQDGGLFNTTTGTVAIALKSTLGADVAAAEAAKVAAEAAQTAAETAQTAAELAETNAETAETNAETAETNAEAARDLALQYRNTANDYKNDAQKLAINAEDSQFTLSDGTTGFSALHHKEKALDAQTASESARDLALQYRNTAQQHRDDAQTALSSTTSEKNLAILARQAAESARDDAEDALDSFDDRYLGSKSSAPTLDNDGNALLTGALYFDSTINGLFVYTGSAWTSANPDLVGDTSPQLGANLDVNGFDIVSVSNGNIDIIPDGTGEVNISKVDIDAGTIDGTAIGSTTASTGAFTTLTTSGNATINGNLTVNGTQTTLNTASLTVDDLNITIADGAANAAAADGAGITVDGANATITYASTGDKWTFNKPLDVTGGITASTSLSAASANITGTVTANAFSGDGSALTNIPAATNGFAIAMAIAL